MSNESEKQIAEAVEAGADLAKQLVDDRRSPLMAAVTLSHATALTYGVIAQAIGNKEADKWLAVLLETLSITLDKIGHPIIVGFTRVPSPDGKEPELPKCGNPDCGFCK